jgi:hypothetical protein
MKKGRNKNEHFKNNYKKTYMVADYINDAELGKIDTKHKGEVLKPAGVFKESEVTKVFELVYDISITLI